MANKRTGPRGLSPPVDPLDASEVRAFPIVGVGASAGGLEAFTELLGHLPVDTGMAFVLVQHLDPQHESALPQLLARATALPVREVTNNLRAKPDCVYVIPPNADLSIVGGVLKLQPRKRTRTPHRSIDYFLESLAQDRGERAIGVVLSGTATDGTLGLEAIKAQGGITFAQDESARYDSMPRSAVAAGCVDLVLPPGDIAVELGRIARHRYVGKAPAGQLAADEKASAASPKAERTPLPSSGRATARFAANRARGDAPRGRTRGTGDREEANGFAKVLHLLRNHSGVDFSLYKSTTIRRRIARRMVLAKQATAEAYAELLRGNAQELQALHSDLLISVTGFFRNPEAFEVLAQKVFPKLIEQSGDAPLRAWVPGCATGQEAYSIAMAFAEATEDARGAPKLQVFATDLNETLLERARHGVYAGNLMHEISPERLRRFFVEEEGGYRVSKLLREMVVFARQDLLADPPFSRMDLISCRNLLIYLEPGVQQKVIPTFHYALKPGGFLFLGASESIGSFPHLFQPVHRKHKIYSRKSAPTPALRLPIGREPEARGLPARGPHPSLPAARGESPDVAGSQRDAQREADRIVLGHFAPPGVLVDADLQILQFRGSTRAYLEPPPGKATLNVLKMARDGLMLPLRAALDQAGKEGRTVRKDNVRVNGDGSRRIIHLEVTPLKNVRERCFLILFEDAEKPGRAVAATAPPDAGAPSGAVKTARAAKGALRRIVELETQLAEMRDYLRSVHEQQESANEDLQAANEEVQSANEELQSLNEELETSKEELESTNEELTTINDEMANRNAELDRLNSDLLNLQTSTRLAIVLLGRDLTVRRFSAQAERPFSLRATDFGRRISEVRHQLVVPETATSEDPRAAPGESPLDLEGLATETIDSVREQEREVRDREGRWFSLRLRPYFAADNKVDGVVLVLVDIDSLKRSEAAIAAARDYAQAIVRTVRDPLLILGADLRIETANEAFYRSFRVSPADTEGRLIYDLGTGQWNIPRLRRLLEEILPRNSLFSDYEVTHDFEGIGRRTMLLDGRTLSAVPGQPARILLGIRDVTEILQFQSAARESAAKLRFMAESMPQKIFTAGPEGDVDYLNQRWTEYTGVPFERLRGGGWTHFIHPRDVDENVRAWRRSIDTGEPFAFEHRIRGADGEYRWHLSRAVAFKDAGGRITQWIGSTTDIHEVKEAGRHKDEFLALLAHELRGPLAPLTNMMAIMRRAGGDPDLMERARGTMERQLAQMTRLVDDLLDIGRISRGKLDLRREPVEIGSAIGQVVESWRPVIDGAKHVLTVTLPPQPVFVHADPVRLAQVFGNLLGNACKYSEPGSRISITVGQQDREVVVAFEDTGIGIDSDMLPRIFDMFTQADRSIERSRGGLGIGLTLVRQLVEMHGGSVQALSEGAGRGSRFVVRLPAPDPSVPPPSPRFPCGESPPAPAAAESAPTVPRRILVVDDNADSADSLALLLSLSGHHTQVARDGVAAVDAAAAFRPEVVLLDVGLPGLNGYGVARRIREQPWGKATRIVAITGWGQDEDRQNSRDAGIDAHVVKPVDYATIARLIAEPAPAAD